MTRTVAVVQARLGSSRFPEKMLARLGEWTLLEWVVTRVRKCQRVDHVVVATTTDPIDDRLVDECKRLGVAVVRGSTNDVLARFVEAVSNDTCDAVVRVCADNPFIDPACVDAAITAYRTEAVDYAFNHRPHGSCNYADGFGAEVVSRALLERLNATQLSAPHREHVTLAVIDGVVQANIHACIAPSSLARPDLRFDVDHPEDLVRLRALVSNGGVTLDSTAAEVVAEADLRGATGSP
ncbi:MAG: cytidylyltransferase domain-containing protein [Ilumatobacteraceae bacterium]